MDFLNVSGPSNPPDELAQNVSKKNPHRTNYSSIFLRKCRFWPFLNYLHDMNSFFWAQRIKSELFFGRTVFIDGWMARMLVVYSLMWVAFRIVTLDDYLFTWRSRRRNESEMLTSTAPRRISSLARYITSSATPPTHFLESVEEVEEIQGQTRQHSRSNTLHVMKTTYDEVSTRKL